MISLPLVVQTSFPRSLSLASKITFKGSESISMANHHQTCLFDVMVNFLVFVNVIFCTRTILNSKRVLLSFVACSIYTFLSYAAKLTQNGQM